MVMLHAEPWNTPDYITATTITGQEIVLDLKSAGPAMVQEQVIRFMKEVYAKAGMSPNWRFE